MKLGYGFIIEYLREHFTVLAASEDCGSSYGMPAVRESDGRVEPGRVYIVDSESIDACLVGKDVLLIVCCSPESKAPNRRAQLSRAKCRSAYVELPPSGVGQLYERLFELFNRETAWQETLWNLSLKGEGSLVESYLEASVDMFDNALLYFPLGGYRSCICVVPNGRESARPLNLLGNDGETYSEDANFESLGAVIDSPTPIVMKVTDKYGSEVNVLVASAREGGGHYVGLFLTPIDAEQATQAEMRHIRLLRDHWEAVLSFHATSGSGENFTACGLMKLLLSEETKNLNEVKRRLKAFGFLDGATYVCAAVNFCSTGPYRKIPLETHLSTIEAMANGVVALKRGSSGAFVIIDVSANQTQPTALFQKIAEYIKPIEIEVGISFPFTGILHLRDYARQAEAALEMESGKPVRMFEDVASRYILSYGTSELPAQVLCAPGLLELQRRSESGIDYVDTLRVYLRSFGNVSLAAKELCLHRSTLLYRLEHICQITRMDLKNPDNRLYLELSLALISQ